MHDLRIETLSDVETAKLMPLPAFRLFIGRVCKIDSVRETFSCELSLIGVHVSEGMMDVCVPFLAKKKKLSTKVTCLDMKALLY